jgi:integrase
MKSASKSRRKSKSIVVSKGSAIARIFTGTSRVNGVDYPMFTLSYYLGATRVRKKFADLEEAKTEANRVVDRIASAELAALKLSDRETRDYVEALDTLRPFGISIIKAVREYAEAVKQLPPGQTLLKAVETFASHYRGLEDVSARDAVDRFIAQKEVAAKHGRAASDAYLKDLRIRLGRFAEAFRCPVSAITPGQVADFLNSLEMSGRTRWNFKRLLGTFFRYAQRQGLYPKNVDPFERDEVEFADEGVVGIFTPEEMSRILRAARPELIPFLTLGGFAGLRTAEVQRLDWSDVDLVNKRIVLAKERTKTRSRRIVPMSDNLAAWLAPHKRPSGPVVEFANLSKQVVWLVDDVNTLPVEAGKEKSPKFEWKHNGLRHSFISYRLAEVMNTAQVALEAGNSETMIFKHYRDIVTKEQAAQWFAIVPDATANVVAWMETASA